MDNPTRHAFIGWLGSKRVFYHNSLFDHAFIQKWLGNRAPRLIGDTLVLFKLMSTEHLHGHGLDSAIKHVLGWPENNKDTMKDMLEKYKLKKGEMGKLADLEPLKFADYCAMDAEAAYQLDIELRSQAHKKGFDDLIYWYRTQYITLERLIIEQRLRGIAIDTEALEVLNEGLREQLVDYKSSFREVPEVQEFLAGFEQEERTEIVKTLGQRKVTARLADQPWLNQEEWTQEIRPPRTAWEEEHGCWVRYKETVRLREKHIKGVAFNVQSKHHLRKLFYDHLGYKPEEFTESELPKIDKKILPKLGDAGMILAEYNKVSKLLGYSDRLASSTRDGILNYNMRAHGTITGRSAGTGGVNFQQLPGDKSYLKCFKARPGHVLVNTDFRSLENVVLAEASRDPGLLELYASGKPHDSYLFVACFVFPTSGLSEVYQPDSPTPESVAAAKKQFKKLRDSTKILVLSSTYGASAATIHRTLNQAGFHYTLDEVVEIRAMYWRLFSGIKKFEAVLKREWEQREGWIINGVGRPICVPEKFLIDIVNRYCQSTGVGLLHRLVYHIDQLRHERKVPMHFWCVDWHDQTIVEVEEEYTQDTVDIFTEAYRLLNVEMDPLILLSGDIDVGKTLLEVK